MKFVKQTATLEIIEQYEKLKGILDSCLFFVVLFIFDIQRIKTSPTNYLEQVTKQGFTSR